MIRQASDAPFETSMADGLFDEGMSLRDAPQEIIARTPAEVRSLREDWLALAERAGGLSLDADPDFFLAAFTWLEPAASPCVVSFRQHGRPRALVVGRLSQRRIECRIGYRRVWTPTLRCLDVVYGGLLMDGTREARTWTLDHLRSRLRSGEIDHISIHHARTDHPVFEELRLLGARRGSTQPTRHSYCSVPEATAEGPGSHRSRARYDRKLQRYFEGRVEVEVATDRESVARYAERASAITEQSYHRGLGVGVDGTPRTLRMLNALAELGYLRAYLLVGNGTPLAYNTLAVRDGHATIMSQSFDPRYRDIQPGNYLLRRILEDFAAHGIRTIDFGFGETVQKNRYGTHFQEEQSFGSYRLGVRALTAWAIEAATAGVAWVVAPALRRVGLLGVVKQRWRARLERKS